MLLRWCLDASETVEKWFAAFLVVGSEPAFGTSTSEIMVIKTGPRGVRLTGL